MWSMIKTWPGPLLLAFQAVQIGYLTYSASDTSAVGWKMFNSVRFESFQVETISGVSRNWEDFTVFPTYGINRKQALGLTRHICRNEPDGSLGTRIKFSTGETFEFYKPSCR
jgi:hypothetical protein